MTSDLQDLADAEWPDTLYCEVHSYSPSPCDYSCCGHECHQHDLAGDDPERGCDVPGCPCAAFLDLDPDVRRNPTRP